jgi:hypothetical protein
MVGECLEDGEVREREFVYGYLMIFYGISVYLI